MSKQSRRLRNDRLRAITAEDYKSPKSTLLNRSDEATRRREQRERGFIQPSPVFVPRPSQH